MLHELGLNPSVRKDIAACLRFYSRLPINYGADRYAMPDFSRVSWATPIAGAVIGSVGAGVVLLCGTLHLPSHVAAAAAIGALALTTGGLHEDGLADVADGFGGGATREQKLAIMRDSRLGAYGALALCVSTLLRVFALAATLERSLFLGALTIIAVSAISRSLGLVPLVTLSPARQDGAGAAAAAPMPSAMRCAFWVGSAIALLPTLGGVSLAQAIVAQIAAGGATLGVTRLAGKQIGGYTGDVLGATQQAAEIAALVALSAG